jgi:hypothetical protein
VTGGFNPGKTQSKLTKFMSKIAYTTRNKTYYTVPRKKIQKKYKNIKQKRPIGPLLYAGRTPESRVFRSVTVLLRQLSIAIPEMDNSDIRRVIHDLKVLQPKVFRFGYQEVLQYLLKTAYGTMHSRAWNRYTLPRIHSRGPRNQV